MGLVRALAFQKCTVNLIIQIENNWINQTLETIYGEIWLVVGTLSIDGLHAAHIYMYRIDTRSASQKLMNLISFVLQFPLDPVYPPHSVLFGSFNSNIIVAMASRCARPKMMRKSEKVDGWMRAEKPHRKTLQVYVAYGITIKC